MASSSSNLVRLLTFFLALWQAKPTVKLMDQHLHSAARKAGVKVAFRKEI
jgi:hypothetical protein